MPGAGHRTASRAEPLLGAVPLEEIDWHISAQDKRLLPNPKSPDKPFLPLYPVILDVAASGRLTETARGPLSRPRASGPVVIS